MKIKTSELTDAAEYRRQLDGCDREADRVRFPDLAFNQWLDEGISDAGHTVWDQLSNICDAWHGWINSALYTEPVKAQAGEPVGYHFSYTTPFGHVVWDIDYTPRPDAIEVYPLVRAHPTTERPYNPLNDYAVISMNPTTERRETLLDAHARQVEAEEDGEPVAWMNKRGDVISAEEKTLIIENGKLGYPGGEFDLHAKNIERSYTIPLGVINV